MKNLLLLTLFFAMGCSTSPRPIAYGEDMCVYCKMSIVDNQHAALAMTDKGKTFKFDAIECLMPFLETQAETDFEVVTVNDYLSPGDMIPAEESTFLISQSIPSPMGAFLSAFRTQDQALTAQRTGGGEIYTWDALLTHFKQ